MIFNNLNKEIKTLILIELAADRVKNVCALCHEKMNMKDYHIQMCRKCRKKYLDEIHNKILSGETQ